MKIRTKYRHTLTLSIIATCIFAAVWGILAYEAYSFKVDIARRAVEAQDQAKAGSRERDLRTTLRSLEPDIAVLDARFIGKDQIPGFISLLEAKAQAAGVQTTIGSIDLDQPVDTVALKNLRVQVTAVGSWRGCVAYLASLGALPFAVSIETVTLGKSSDGGGVWNLSVNLSAKATHEAI